MRILLLSECGDAAWLVWLLQHEGHTVDWSIHNHHYADVLSGIIPPPLERIHNTEEYNLIIFDTTDHGSLADGFRNYAPVIGSSEFAQQLEGDREFGINIMESAGIKVPSWQAFDTTQEAKEWLNKTHKRCVFKPFDSDCNLTYVSKSAEDLIRYMDRLSSKIHGRFILQEFVVGTEISTEGYFNGKEWCLINHTLEEKKFLSGNLGPNHGCSGNVVWIPSRSTPVFDRGLRKVEDILRQYNYVGPIDLNTIVTEGEVYGIEWTPRFGYEGTCNLVRLLPFKFGEFLHRIACGESMDFTTSRYRFCAAIRISVPPYPTKDYKRESLDVPIQGLNDKKLDTFYLNDVKKEGNELLVAGTSGFIGAPLGCGDSIKQSFDECKGIIKKLEIPDLQWRSDITESIQKRYDTLMAQGWLRQNELINA